MERPAKDYIEPPDNTQKVYNFAPFGKPEGNADTAAKAAAKAASTASARASPTSPLPQPNWSPFPPAAAPPTDAGAAGDESVNYKVALQSRAAAAAQPQASARASTASTASAAPARSGSGEEVVKWL